MATSKTASTLLLMMLLVVALPGTAQAGRGLLQERGDRPTSPRTDRPDTYTTEDDCVEAKFEWDAENEACVGRHPRVDGRGTATEGRPARREQKSQGTRPSDADDADTSGRSLLQRDSRRGPPPFTFTSEVDCVEAGFVWEADSQRCIPEAIKDDVEQPFQYVTEEACLAADFEWDGEHGACVGRFPPTDGHRPRRQQPPQGSGPSNAADNGRSLLQRDSRRGPPPFTFTSEVDCVEAGFVWEAVSQRCIPEDIKEGVDQPFQYATEEECVAAEFEWDAEHDACVGKRPPRESTDGSNTTGRRPPMRQGRGGRSLLKHYSH